LDFKKHNLNEEFIENFFIVCDNLLEKFLKKFFNDKKSIDLAKSDFNISLLEYEEQN